MLPKSVMQVSKDMKQQQSYPATAPMGHTNDQHRRITLRMGLRLAQQEGKHDQYCKPGHLPGAIEAMVLREEPTSGI